MSLPDASPTFAGGANRRSKPPTVGYPARRRRERDRRPLELLSRHYLHDVTFYVIARGNTVKKMVGLNIFQTSVFMLYISVGKIDGGTAPSHRRPGERFQSPTTCSYPHRDGLCTTTAVGYALITLIYEAYG